MKIIILLLLLTLAGCATKTFYHWEDKNTIVLDKGIKIEFPCDKKEDEWWKDCVVINLEKGTKIILSEPNPLR